MIEYDWHLFWSDGQPLTQSQSDSILLLSNKCSLCSTFGQPVIWLAGSIASALILQNFIMNGPVMVKMYSNSMHSHGGFVITSFSETL